MRCKRPAEEQTGVASWQGTGGPGRPGRPVLGGGGEAVISKRECISLLNGLQIIMYKIGKECSHRVFIGSHHLASFVVDGDGAGMGCSGRRERRTSPGSGGLRWSVGV